MNADPPVGVYDPAVTQDTIAKTIGDPAWIRARRPPMAYTNRLKLRQMTERGLSGGPQLYEEDHLVPLELGGHPTDPRNLWPQPIKQAKAKDKWENYLHKEVLSGRTTLAEARARIVDPALWNSKPPRN